MTETAQRIAIAKWMGYVYPGDRHGMVPPDVACVDELPDFTQDLNAMHEAERHLLQGDWNYADRDRYAENLRTMIGPHGTMRSFDYAHATAAQRAEALLRTLGLWQKDGGA